jgi:hypothetical protein
MAIKIRLFLFDSPDTSHLFNPGMGRSINFLAQADGLQAPGFVLPHTESHSAATIINLIYFSVYLRALLIRFDRGKLFE